MTDVALVLDRLCPGAAYEGSLTAGTREAFEAIRWSDQRPKPKWEEVEAVVLPAPERLVAKAVVISRLTGDQLNAALALLLRDGRLFARWTNGRDVLDANDPDVLALLQAIGADPEKVLAT